MKPIDKSIQLAYQLNEYTPDNYKFMHYAFLFRRNKLISVGQNNPVKTNAKAYHFAKRFNLDKWREFSYLHAELDCIARVWGRVHLDHRFSLYSLRINKLGELSNAKPCPSCSELLNILQIQTFWSTEKGKIDV